METFKKLFLLFFLMHISLGYAQPAAPAPAPPARNAADVIRVYTDSYATSTAIAGPSWANSTETTISGNATRWGNNVTYSQVAFGATNITGMTHIHLDIYTNPGSPTQMRLQVGGSFSSMFATPNGQWTSIDIPMAVYGSPASVNLINIQTGTGTASTFYYDNLYFWKPAADPNLPVLTNPTATTFLPTSATLGANITSTGTSAITARGTAYKTTTPVVATDNQLAEGSTALGVYTQSRTGLSPQTRYYYVGYATNASGTAISPEGNFRTLSNPPTVQPATFTTTPGTVSLVANWGAATFPSSGASRGGYLVIYSTGTPSLTSVNGSAPAAVGTIVNVGNTALPAAPPLTTTITGLTGGTLYNLLIIPYTWDGTNATTYNYLTSGARTTTGTPMAMPAAPTPTRLQANVVSVYSSAYTTAVTGINYNGGVSYIASGNETKLYTNTGNGGITFTATAAAASMTHLHIDIFTTTSTATNVMVLGNAQTGQYPTPNGVWTSLDIPAAALGGFASVNTVKILPYAGAGTFYIDNVYYWKPAPALIAPTITLADMSYVLGDAPFTVVATSNSDGAFTYNSNNPAVATISGNTVTIVGVGTATITANQAATATYDSGSVTATLTVTAPPLATAAPTPPARNDWDVISLYSNAYITQANPVWQNIATTTDEVLEGNDTKKMSNFLVEIIDFDPVNLTEMTTLHMDVYSNDCTGMNIWLLNNGDRNAQISLIPNQWNSINIPLSTYSALGLNMNGVHLLKFESLNGGGKTVFVDNVYFFRPATALPPTLTNFTIAAQTVGNPDFVLTQPTSNSAGAFTYTSSNTAVATISGSTVHIVGGGTSTITATQAADGIYGSASITAQLTVAFLPPGPSPIPPARTPDRVVSMYTGNPPTYANAITAVRSSWTGATTLTEVPNGTNTALRLDNFGFLGLVDQNETHFSVAGMSHLHLDIYLNAPLNSNPALSRVFIFLLSNGDHLYNAPNLVAGWNSLSIPLSQFPAANLADIYGLKFEQNTSSPTQIYIDNIYFSNECYTYYADADNDGYGDAANSLFACELTPGYVLNDTDCNDAVAAINPGAGEILYNGVDDNCDGNLDEGNQITTQIIASQCGTTLPAMGSNISAVSTPQATGYRFEVTNTATNAVQMIEKPVQYFNLTQLASYDYETTYSIRVMLQRNGVWLGYYGPACLVSSPAVTQPGGAAQVSPSQCGITLSSINTLIATTSTPGVTSYRFRVTNISDPSAPNQVQQIDRSLHWFNLPMLANYNYGTTYIIEVALKTNGAYSAFGNACQITSPAVPTIDNCGAIIALPTTHIQTQSLAKVTSYRFEITNLDNNQVTTLDRSQHWFTFKMVPDFAPSTQYGIRVAIMSAGVYSLFSDACEITSPGFARPDSPKEESVSKAEFSVVSYPNPFTAEFSIDVATASQENVQYKVYDMIGKVVEAGEINLTDLNREKIGSQYPSGIYNVIVTQGPLVKTLRVIKR